MDNYGTVYCNLEIILKERGISKNRIIIDLEISRQNLNHYCRNEFQRIDINFISKLCFYLDLAIDDLFTYEKPKQLKNLKKISGNQIKK